MLSTNGPRTYLALALALLVAGSVAACDSGGEDGEEAPLAESTFEATVSGDTSATLSGEAFYAIAATDVDGNPLESGPVFQLGMLEGGDDTTAVVLARPSDEVPDVGTYEIADIEIGDDPEDLPADAFIAAFISQAGESYFISQSGTLEITRSGGDPLEGTFAFEARPLIPFGSPSSARIEVEGAFNATQIENPEALPESNALLRTLTTGPAE